jgi:hypothetical protein
MLANVFTIPRSGIASSRMIRQGVEVHAAKHHPINRRASGSTTKIVTYGSCSFVTSKSKPVVISFPISPIATPLRKSTRTMIPIWSNFSVIADGGR